MAYYAWDRGKENRKNCDGGKSSRVRESAGLDAVGWQVVVGQGNVGRLFSMGKAGERK